MTLNQHYLLKTFLKWIGLEVLYLILNIVYRKAEGVLDGFLLMMLAYSALLYAGAYVVTFWEPFLKGKKVLMLLIGTPCCCLGLVFNVLFLLPLGEKVVYLSKRGHGMIVYPAVVSKDYVNYYTILLDENTAGVDIRSFVLGDKNDNDTIL